MILHIVENSYILHNIAIDMLAILVYAQMKEDEGVRKRKLFGYAVQ
jgi:hypothetical protein